MVPSTRVLGDGVVHAVETAQESALAAAGRSDQGSHLVLVHLQADIIQGFLGSVEKIQMLDVKNGCVGSMLMILPDFGLYGTDQSTT